MILSLRFIAVTVSIVATFMLSACQPKSDDNAKAADSVVAPTVAEPSSTQIANDESIKTDKVANNIDATSLNEDYSKAMTSMNDEMMIGMAYNDPDIAFAKSMLGLHRGAISMTELQLKYGQDSEMRSLAEEMKIAQQQNIDIMNKWLASHPDIANPKPDTEAMQRAYADIVSSMNYKIRLGVDTSLADTAFARGMFPHQIAAIDLAKVQLRYGKDQDMRRLAVQLVNNQPKVINDLQSWLAINDTSTNKSGLKDYDLKKDPSTQQDKLDYESEPTTTN